MDNNKKILSRKKASNHPENPASLTDEPVVIDELNHDETDAEPFDNQSELNSAENPVETLLAKEPVDVTSVNQDKQIEAPIPAPQQIKLPTLGSASIQLLENSTLPIQLHLDSLTHNDKGLRMSGVLHDPEHHVAQMGLLINPNSKAYIPFDDSFPGVVLEITERSELTEPQKFVVQLPCRVEGKATLVLVLVGGGVLMSVVESRKTLLATYENLEFANERSGKFLHSMKSIDPWHSLNSTSSKAREGYIDEIIGGTITGWYFSGIPSTFEKLKIFIDGKYSSDVIADQYRADLDAEGLNNGLCSFVWRIPECLRDAKNHTIDICTNDGESLCQSPVNICGLPENDEHLISYKSTANDRKNLFINPDIYGLDNLRRNVVKGVNNVADNWTMFADSTDVDCISFWHSTMELPSTDKIVSALRIKGKKRIKLLHLFGEIYLPKCYFLLPFTLFFHLSNLNKAHPVTVILRLGNKSNEGKFTAFHKATAIQGAGVLGDISITIPVDIINKIIKEGDKSPVLMLEFSGDINIEITQFRLGIGFEHYDLNPALAGEFEDPIISEQAKTIDVFFEAGELSVNQSNAAKWHSWPEQQLPEIVIPVYDALEYVQRCLQSIIKFTECPYLLTLVDDGSTPECNQWLDDFARDKPWVKVLHNQFNMGYTLAINRAIRESTGCVIVLLNSDTEVSPRWLMQLIAVANSNSQIGIVGPLSNAASWQSVPKIKSESGAWAVNSLPQGVSISAYAEKIRYACNGEHPDVPILNGFCLYIKRDVFDSVGLFDEEAFPKGYGEENDFCFRAVDAGFTLKIATDTYIYHAKTKSFGNNRREELIKQANITLKKRYGEERFKQLESTLSNLPVLESIRLTLENSQI